MNIVTPEVIFDRFTTRLIEKYDSDLSCIIYAGQGFEKWLQWELFLCMTDLAPVVYGFDDKEIVSKKPENEKVCEIRLEYKIEPELKKNVEKKGNIIPDLMIAETPFLSEYIDRDTWKVKGEEESKSEIIKDIQKLYYEESFFHYIELKTEWCNLDKTDVPKCFKEDFDKISGLKKNAELRNDIGMRTYAAISLITSKTDVEGKDIFEAIKKYEKWVKNKTGGFTFLHSEISENTFLIGAYKNFDIKSN